MNGAWSPVGARKAASAGLVALALAGSTVVPASADTGATIIERCTHGQSLGGFSQQAYRQALAEMPAEVNEYSECATRIRKAELTAAGQGGSGGGAGGGGALAAPVAPPSPAEQQTLQAAHSPAGAAPVNVGGQVVVPGVVHANVASAVTSLPAPLLAVLALLVAGVVAVVVRMTHGRVRDRHDG